MDLEIVTIHEDIVSSTVDNLHKDIGDIIADGKKNILIDMEEVAIIDSTGIGFIIKVQNTLKRMNGSLVLRNVNSDIMRMFKVMRLDQHITIE